MNAPARRIARLATLLLCIAVLPSLHAQNPVPDPQDAPAASVAGDQAAPATPAELKADAWRTLTDAAADKRPETRIQALAALGNLADPRSVDLIAGALTDPDLDVRTAAILAAGQTRQTLLIGKLHGLLDDREPQVAFAAATTLWKLKDHSGEDILVAVAAGERSANATFVNGTMRTASKDLHNPSTLARMGAEQGASILLGPFGFGIGAYEAMRKNGGSSARVQAIEQLAEEHNDHVRKQLLGALTDKDPGVRAAAAKALGAYPEAAVSKALANLFIDPRPPVRYTAAAAYLRTIGPVPPPGHLQSKHP